MHALQAAADFHAETLCLAEVLRPLGETDFSQVTLFKSWTIDDILGHLHLFNVAAIHTLQSPQAFEALFAPIREGLARGKTMVETQRPWLKGLGGRALFNAWLEGSEEVLQCYQHADPKHRVKWGGPDMSVLSCITARQMETWAHGQAIFDLLGVTRVETDRLRNIAHLGAGTYGWAFTNRRWAVPQPAPSIELVAPSGDQWTWNEPQADNCVRGLAVDFARVVTQVRHVLDTALQVKGVHARQWMQIAQCFAGPPSDPPAPGTRVASTAAKGAGGG